MDPTYYHILHIVSLLVLSGWTFMGCANPDPNRRKQTLMITGIAGLIMFISGMGLAPKLGYSMGSTWIIVKLVCWAGLMALAGMAFRKPGAVRTLTFVILGLLATAVVMVYVKPGSKARVVSDAPEVSPNITPAVLPK